MSGPRAAYRAALDEYRQFGILPDGFATMPEASGRVTIELAGASRDSRETTAWAVIVRNDQTGDVVAGKSGAIGASGTYVPEYTALVAGLEAALARGANRVVIRTHVGAVLNQLKHADRMHSPVLTTLIRRYDVLAARFSHVELQKVYRETNGEVVALAKRALDLPVGRPAGAPVRSGSAGSGKLVSP